MCRESAWCGVQTLPFITELHPIKYKRNVLVTIEYQFYCLRFGISARF